MSGGCQPIAIFIFLYVHILKVIMHGAFSEHIVIMSHIAPLVN